MYISFILFIWHSLSELSHYYSNFAVHFTLVLLNEDNKRHISGALMPTAVAMSIT